jgi:hypothetical protein
MNASLSFGPDEQLISGISASGEDIPPHFVATTALVIEPGINRAFETWGRFLTDLAGKTRPANDADFSLRYLGYWTDHGARYYYSFEVSLGYAGTLRKVRDEFRSMNIRLGYLQLDSWFYPKGHDGKWNSTDPLRGGTWNVGQGVSNWDALLTQPYNGQQPQRQGECRCTATVVSRSGAAEW